MLVACIQYENRLVIHDLKTNEQVENEEYAFRSCDTSAHRIVVVTGCGKVFETSHIQHQLEEIPCPDSHASCAAFGYEFQGVLAIGFLDGSIVIRDIIGYNRDAHFRVHEEEITNMRFAPDGRLLVASYDKTASVVRFDKENRLSSCIKLIGHTDCVIDMLYNPLSGNCISSSNDMTMRVWDLDNGTCIRTVTQHTPTGPLALHPSGRFFCQCRRKFDGYHLVMYFVGGFALY